MICPDCDGKGIVLADLEGPIQRDWDGSERRNQKRGFGNDALRFQEVVPAAHYQSCPLCQGGGRLYPNLLSV